MLEELKNIKSEKSDLRKFGLTVGIVLMIIAGLLFWKEKESSQIFFGVGAIILLTTITIPVILKPVYSIWMVLGIIIGWIMTRIILSLLFYIILTPIGLVLRLFGKQVLELRWNKSEQSYWNYRIKENLDHGNYERQF